MTIGVLLLTSPMQGTMERLFTLQDKMILYFLIAAGVAMVIALVFSRVITRPIVSLTRSIQRMGRGDLSVRVPGQGQRRAPPPVGNVQHHVRKAGNAGQKPQSVRIQCQP